MRLFKQISALVIFSSLTVSLDAQGPLIPVESPETEVKASPSNTAHPFVQTKDVVYAEVHGTGLLMDVFTPTGTGNGLAIIDVASGAWESDRGKIRDHEQAQIFDIICGRGYTVFAIRPGSRTKYSLKEMDQNVKLGIRRVKQLASQYKFDPEKLGIAGASAGGHLATLAAFTPEAADPRSDDELKSQYSTNVAAVGAFFPPTDFLEWRPGDSVNRIFLSFILCGNGVLKSADVAKMPMEELTELAKEISPLHRLTSATVPILVIHGDADPVVHLSHSEKLVSAVQSLGGSAKLIVKAGGAHPWPTIHEEVKVVADWFDENLK